MTIIGLILARRGSKEIPGKNLVTCGGKPLIAHSILAALASARFQRVLVSTDEEEIANVAREWGAEVPFRRPLSLSGDGAPILGVMQHALKGSSINAHSVTKSIFH